MSRLASSSRSASVRFGVDCLRKKLKRLVLVGLESVFGLVV